MTCFQGWNVKNLQTLRHRPQILAPTRPQPPPNQSNPLINNNKPKFLSNTPQTPAQADPQAPTGDPPSQSKPAFGFLAKKSQQNPAGPLPQTPNTTNPAPLAQPEEVPKKKPGFAFIKKAQPAPQDLSNTPAPQGQLNQSEVVHTENGTTPEDGNLNRTQETPKKKPAFGFIKKKPVVANSEGMEGMEQQKTNEILETDGGDGGTGVENP